MALYPPEQVGSQDHYIKYVLFISAYVLWILYIVSKSTESPFQERNILLLKIGKEGCQKFLNFMLNSDLEEY